MIAVVSVCVCVLCFEVVDVVDVVGVHVMGTHCSPKRSSSAFPHFSTRTHTHTLLSPPQIGNSIHPHGQVNHTALNDITNSL